ncbi:Condensin complex subunit 1 [Durusdinium trenchii]|uniref:Condensin complex subunit 1 n=1 Tax=Durusdinium trenchii TaxID=1381693 RepID=A0ABP0SC11_9DINO
MAKVLTIPMASIPDGSMWQVPDRQMIGEYLFWQQQQQQLPHQQLPETQPWFPQNAPDAHPAEASLWEVQDRQMAGEYLFWQQQQQQQQHQQLPETQPWFPENAPDVTPAELALLQRLNATETWWNSEASAAAVQQQPEDWTSMWWEGARSGMEIADSTEKTVQEADPDKGLAKQMTSAVQLFLAGEDEESEDEAFPEPAPSGEATSEAVPTQAMTINAQPFVPTALQASNDMQVPASTSRTELRLDEILPKANSPMLPTSEGLNNFIGVLQRRPLPPDLEDNQTNLKKFEAAIAKAVLNFYKKRMPPTVKMLQKELRETNQLPEEWLNVLLQVCARDASKVYYIQPTMRGEQPTIYLARPPLWFQGFLADEDDIKQQVAIESVSGDQKRMMPAVPLAPVGQVNAEGHSMGNAETKETKRKARSKNEDSRRRSSEKVPKPVGPTKTSPLTPGVVDQPGQHLEARVAVARAVEASDKKADSDYSNDTNDKDEAFPAESHVGNPDGLDVSGLLEELMLASSFAHAMMGPSARLPSPALKLLLARSGLTSSTEVLALNPLDFRESKWKVECLCRRKARTTHTHTLRLGTGSRQTLGAIDRGWCNSMRGLGWDGMWFKAAFAFHLRPAQSFKRAIANSQRCTVKGIVCTVTACDVTRGSQPSKVAQ